MNKISLSWTLEVITKSEDELEKSPIAVPPSLKVTLAPSASRIISPPASIVRSAPSEIVEPLIVISSTVRVVSVPRLVMFGCAAVDSVPDMPLENTAACGKVTAPPSAIVIALSPSVKPIAAVCNSPLVFMSPLTSNLVEGELVPTPKFPELSTLSLSDPAVSIVTVSALGNLKKVLLSPVCPSLSAIVTSPATSKPPSKFVSLVTVNSSIIDAPDVCIDGVVIL